jgi:hypothetical protein
MHDTLTLVRPCTHQHGQAFPLLALNDPDLSLLGLLRLDRQAEPSQPLPSPSCRPSVPGYLVLGRRGSVIHCLITATRHVLDAN